MTPIDAISARAAALIITAALEGLARQEDYVRRLLLRGGKIDTVFLTEIDRELNTLIDRISDDTVNGGYKDLVLMAAREGVQEAKGQAQGDGLASGMAQLDYEQIRLALFNSKVRIKGLMEPGVKVVNEIITAAMVSGRGPEEIADQIRDKLAELKGMTQARAELIAHSEILSVYRQQALAIGRELGYQYYQYLGPLDGRTEQICRDALNVITTEDEWAKVDPLVFTYGLHYGCRHQLVAVLLEKPQAYKKSIGGTRITAYREAA